MRCPFVFASNLNKMAAFVKFYLSGLISKKNINTGRFLDMEIYRCYYLTQVK